MKELLVFGERTFKIKVPDDAAITFGPWSPPRKDLLGAAARGGSPPT
jgi:hypothetical protein